MSELAFLPFEIRGCADCTPGAARTSWRVADFRGGKKLPRMSEFVRQVSIQHAG